MIATYLPTPSNTGRPRLHSYRELLNAMFYIIRSGCAWRLLPHDLPNWKTMYHSWRMWRPGGTWERLNAALRERERQRVGRTAQPSAGLIDSQTAKTTGVGGPRGYDGAKKVNGRKRHLLVDTLGLVLRVEVHAADLQDRAAVPLLLDGMPAVFPSLAHVWVDQGHTRSGKTWIEQELGWTVTVVQHPPKARGEWRPDVASDHRPLQALRRALFAAGQQQIARALAAAPNDRTSSRVADELEELEDELELLEADVNALVTEKQIIATSTMQRQHRATLYQMSLGCLLLAALVVLIAVRMRLIIVRPITTLSGAAYAVAQGDLDHTVPVSNTIEVGDLQHAFNTMVRALKQHAHDLLQEREELAQQVVVQKGMDLVSLRCGQFSMVAAHPPID